MKKTISFLLCVFLIIGAVSMTAVGAEEEIPTEQPIISFGHGNALFASAVNGSENPDAWIMWQRLHDADGYEAGDNNMYFFLPSSADDSELDVYNGFSSSVTLNGVTIPSDEIRTVPYAKDTAYSVTADGSSYVLRVMKSSAEASVYINNSDYSGRDFFGYLNQTKENTSAATGAVVSASGKIDVTPVKKIKGRGNTSWGKPKKGYNVTFESKVSIAGMKKNKKYSLVPNYQDDSESRNRLLFDLSDAVGMPYASDSRYVDVYSNGYYWGAYQMAEKVEEGSLVTDVKGNEYLNADGTVNADFPFIAEVDASAGDGDYYVTLDNNVKITIKAPEVDPGMPGYEEVKAYVRTKCNALMTACQNAADNNSADLSGIVDLPSVTKLFMINELGKNWDAGVSSTFFTYKQDENGVYKFYGSPVWDYDNSLGNAVGVANDLQNFGVDNYTSYEGWWCRFKDKSRYSNTSTNIINNLARTPQIKQLAAEIWFEEFIPAINHLSGATDNAVIAEELYSEYEYYTLVKDSAQMNYTSGWPIRPSYNWVADHNSLRNAEYDVYTGVYTVDSDTTYYAQNIKGAFRYAADWLKSRAAWLSSQWRQDYTGSTVRYDVDRNSTFGINDVTETMRFIAEFNEFDALGFENADANNDGVVNVLDVTMMQRMLADVDVTDDYTVRPDPWNEFQPEVPRTVIYVDTLGWGATNIHYWGNGQSTSWPGVPMNTTTVNGRTVYTFVVPETADYIIFCNSDGTVQTNNIPYDGQVHIYSSLESVNPEKPNRHDYQIDGIIL